MEHLKLLAEKVLNSETGFNQIRFSNLKERSGLHSHDFFEFFACTKGSIKHHVNGECQLITEGTCVFIRPEDKHYYEEISCISQT
jgi:AraC family cel operon transcriptional repressor